MKRCFSFNPILTNERRTNKMNKKKNVKNMKDNTDQRIFIRKFLLLLFVKPRKRERNMRIKCH